MSTFYGTIKGNRGDSTRCGSKESGIRTSAQSWNGSVIVDMRYWGEDLMVGISCSDGSASYGNLMWRGTFEELKELLRSA